MPARAGRRNIWQRSCQRHCGDYQAASCHRLERAPYVCNGCGIRSCRQNTKYYYRAQYSNQNYHEVLSSSRSGINKTPLELDDMDRIISPLLKQGQPLGHIFATHGQQLGCSRRTLYHYIEQGAFSAGNLDLPRKVRYKPRKVRKPLERSLPSYRADRTYKDFEKYMEAHPETSVVEMDTVEGTRGGPIADGTLDVKRFITGYVGVQEALERLSSANTSEIKIVIRP